MDDIKNLNVYTTEHGGKWYAATNRSPYFCFEATSEAGALSRAASALAFYATTKLRFREESLSPQGLEWKTHSAIDLLSRYVTDLVPALPPAGGR